MTNDSIEFCNRPGRSNPLTPNIESQLQCLFAWIWKATHAFLNHPLGLNIPPIPWDDRRAFTSLAAAVMALTVLLPAIAAPTEATLYVFPESGDF